MAPVLERETRRAESSARPAPEPPVDVGEERPASVQGVLMSVQRSAGNAAAVRLMRQGGGPAPRGAPLPGTLQRREAPAAETAPAEAASPAAAGGGAVPTSPAGPTHATDWFVDYDQMKRGGGKAADRGKGDVLWVESLIVGSGSTIREFTGFNAARSGPARVGHWDHPAGSGHVSGNINYVSAADVKVGTSIRGAAPARGVAARQKTVAENAARAYVSEQFHAQQGDEKELERGAAAAADAALAADAAAGDGSAPTPTSAVDISVVGRRRDQPALPTVNYEIGADSDCYVYVVVPGREYAASVSKTTNQGSTRFERREGSSGEHTKAGGSVDVGGSGSSGRQQTKSSRVQTAAELRAKYAASFARLTKTAVSTTLTRTFRDIVTELHQSNESESSTTTTTTKKVDPISIDVEGEDQIKKGTPSLWDRAFDFVKDKLNGYLKKAVLKYADKLAGQYRLLRLIPGSVRRWAERKIVDLVWKGGSWLWNKITGGEAEVQTKPETSETVTDVKVENERRKQSAHSFEEVKRVSEEASVSFGKTVSEEARVLFERELHVSISTDTQTSTTTSSSTSGSVDVHAEGERETDTRSGGVSEAGAEGSSSTTYTTDLVRIETGKPVIELTVRPKGG